MLTLAQSLFFYTSFLEAKNSKRNIRLFQTASGNYLESKNCCKKFGVRGLFITLFLIVFSFENDTKGNWDHLLFIYFLKIFILKATHNSIKLSYENSILIMANREHLEIIDSVGELLKLSQSTSKT